jgi:hypothetical protein
MIESGLLFAMTIKTTKPIMHLRLLIAAAATVTCFPATATAAHLYKESEYRDAWCKGQTEVTLYDGSRVDCLTKNYAIEFDFAPKAFEALGQSIHYALVTGTDPAIVLIMEKPNDWRYYRRIKRTAKARNVKLWFITPETLNRRQKEK